MNEPSAPAAPPPRAPAPQRAFVLTTVALVAFNVARALGWFGRGEDLAAVGLLVGVAGIAVATGLTRGQVGLTGAAVRRGLAYGCAACALVAVVVVVAAAVPATSGFLDDARVDVGVGSMLWQVGFGILVATVLPEELAFRGVLLGSGTAAWGPRPAVLSSSALFGLWHVAPTLSTSEGNAGLAEVTAGGGGDALVVVAAVLATAIAGLVFCWLRLRSASLVAPVLAHLGTNAITFVVAWVVAR